MRLVATYSFRYGPKSPLDADMPIVNRGEEFDALPSGIASASEVGRSLIRSGVGVPPDTWAKRKQLSDANALWAQEFVADARAKQRRGRGA